MVVPQGVIPQGIFLLGGQIAVDCLTRGVLSVVAQAANEPYF
jgi:hypothetical protein